MAINYVMNTDYSTNLTDKQWQVIEKVINPQERARKHSLRDIMNAILYINKTGCQWRLLPREFGPWQTAYSPFDVRSMSVLCPFDVRSLSVHCPF